MMLSFMKNGQSQVPAICYHNILEKTGNEDQLHISRARLSSQLKALHDSGYTSVLPSDIYDHLMHGKALPSRPVMISFDDSRVSQFKLALPLLEQYNFRAVFFVMTVTINKTGYLSADQLRELSRRGHTIGAHTYDHRNLKDLAGKEWDKQVVQPKKLLENITGKAITSFAYPYGVHTSEAVARLKAAGYHTGFKLLDNKVCSDELYCLPRLMVNGKWTAATFIHELRRYF